jgi:nucleosome binding factor SPN SPT16 subunit
MTFQVSMGFSGLDNPDGKDDQSKTYALFLGDTVVVNEVKNPRKCVGIFFQGTVLE